MGGQPSTPRMDPLLVKFDGLMDKFDKILDRCDTENIEYTKCINDHQCGDIAGIFGTDSRLICDPFIHVRLYTRHGCDMFSTRLVLKGNII